MKYFKLIISIIMVFEMKISLGQINQIQQYDSVFHFSYIKLETSGIKLVIINQNNNIINVYNTNFSLFKQIAIPSQPNQNYSISYLREILFNTDSTDLEYILMGYSGVPVIYYIKIYDELGNVLFARDSASLNGGFGYVPNGIITFPIFNTDSTAVMNLRSSINNGPINFYLYSLPGKLEECCCDDFATGLIGSDSPQRFSFNTFPNPSKDRVVLQYELPQGINKAELIIYSVNGIEMIRYKVTDAFKRLELDISDLSPGTYFYQLLLPGGAFGTQKMIVVK